MKLNFSVSHLPVFNLELVKVCQSIHNHCGCNTTLMASCFKLCTKLKSKCHSNVEALLQDLSVAIYYTLILFSLCLWFLRCETHRKEFRRISSV